MKKIISLITILLFLSCSSDDELNPNEIINDVSISKITVISSSNFKEVFELNSKNQIVKEIITTTTNNIITYNYEYDNSGKLVKQTRIPSEVNGNEYFFKTEYNSNGLFKKHKSGTGSGYSISVDNSDIKNPLIKKSLGGYPLLQNPYERKWEFNDFDELISIDANKEYTYSENNLISEKYIDNDANTSTIDYSSIKNPIAIVKKNTYGKRNLSFYFYDPIYPFRDKILDISSNIFSNSIQKFTSYENDGITIKELFITMNVEIINQNQNYVTHFKVKTKDETWNREYTNEYIIELK
jgi:YD repeat-containing protein